MAEGESSLRAEIRIGNDPLNRELEPLVETVIVDDHLHLPDTFVIVLRDAEQRATKDAGLEIGKRVAISGTALGETEPQPLITGEVTSLEAQYDARGARAIVRGYDPSHRLHRGRRTEVHHNAKDSDIAKKLAERVRLDVGEIQDTVLVHDHVSQLNLSDWEFLKSRAREIGFELSVIDGKLNLRRPAPSAEAPAEGDFNSTNPLQLVLGQEGKGKGELLEFRPRISSAQQVKDVKVRGWDPLDKKVLVGEAKAETTSADLKIKPAELAHTFGDPSHVVVDRPLSTLAGLNAAAAAVAEQIASSFAEAELVARGNPNLKAGTPVSISGLVADEFVGRYTLTHTRHIFDKEGYRTEATVSGRQERSLLGLASLGGTNGTSSAAGPPVYGVVIGLVSQNNDPERLGRVKLSFPWLDGNYVSDWARLAQTGAGPGSGSVFIPDVGDEVLVAFEFGDVRRPYVIGGLYNRKDKPVVPRIDNGRVTARQVISRKGHRITFNDGGDQDGIEIRTADEKLAIRLNAAKKTLDLTGNDEVSVFARTKLLLMAEEEDVTVLAKNINIQAQKRLFLSGNSVHIKAFEALTVEGKPISLNPPAPPTPPSTL